MSSARAVVGRKTSSRSTTSHSEVTVLHLDLIEVAPFATPEVGVAECVASSSATCMVTDSGPIQTGTVNIDLTLQEPALSKGLLWMRAVRRRTLDYWYSTVEGPDAAHIEAAMATVAMNVVDEAVFYRSHGDHYRDHRRTHPQGRVVMGMELIRNCEVHATELCNLTTTATFGVPELGFRQVLAWPDFESLPVDYRQQQDGEPRARGEARDAYRKWVAGRPVIETLLDAIAYFESLDSRLRPAENVDLRYSFVPPVALGVNEEMFVCRPIGLDQVQLVLPDLACRNTERRSPAWPSADQWLKEQDRAIRKQAPAGTSREICARIVDERGKLIGYWGYAGDRDEPYRYAWVERAPQVGRDIRMGFRYFLLAAGVEVDVVADDQLNVVAAIDGLDALGSVTSEESVFALDHLAINEANPDLYRHERLAR